MIPALESEYNEFKKYFELESSKHFLMQAEKRPALNKLWESMQYTYFLDGKRFRPFLSALTAQALKKSFSNVLPLALAVECVHTYSLIHDDLPCMDNDDFRRGKPSNHKVYGEDIALLAGDALLTEAFSILSGASDLKPAALLKTINLLAEKIGAQGMVGGQVLDMKVESNIQIDQLETIHLLKTAYLIETAVVGSALLLKASVEQIKLLSDFSINLGIAFQIKDDLLDGLDSDQDFKNYIQILGLEKTEKALQDKSQKAHHALDQLSKTGLATDKLKHVIDFNVQRNR